MRGSLFFDPPSSRACGWSFHMTCSLFGLWEVKTQPPLLCTHTWAWRNVKIQLERCLVQQKPRLKKKRDFRQEEKIKKQDLKCPVKWRALGPPAQTSVGDDSFRKRWVCVSTDAFCFPRRNRWLNYQKPSSKPGCLHLPQPSPVSPAYEVPALSRKL